MQGLESGVHGETETQGGSQSAQGLPDLWPCLSNLSPGTHSPSPSFTVLTLDLRDPPFCLLGDPLTPLPPGRLPGPGSGLLGVSRD